ncbi:MAG: hypothetical protein R3F42_11090 [Pseudomonadota bacterium]
MPSRSCRAPLLALGILLVALTAGAAALTDPTRPTGRGHAALLQPHAQRHDWRLDSTLVAPDRRVAVINGRQVSEGESVDGARVIEIRRLEVLIQARGRQLTLQLLPDIVQQQP